MNKKKILILAYILLLGIFYIFFQHKRNQNQNTINLMEINVSYIDNKNVNSIINDSILKDGVYLLKNENDNKPTYIFFKGKNNMVKNISVKLKNSSIEISATRDTSSNKSKLLYEFINYDNYANVSTTLKINKEAIDLGNIIFESNI